jgi:hypothetical protein
MPPSEQRVLCLSFAVTSVALFAAALVGHAELLAYSAPVLVLALPLLRGRYVGEDRLARLAARVRRRPLRPRSVAAPAVRRRSLRALPRGGRLIAHALAGRPPPLRASA